MIHRFNYLPPSGHRRILNVAVALAVDPRLRAAVLSVAGSLLLVCGMWMVQSIRLAAAERDEVFYSAAQSRTARELRGVEQLDARVAELKAIAASVDVIRRSGIRHESELASIGNQLPSGVWLAGITSEAGGWRIEGRSERIGAVGSAMTALRGMPHIASTRLVTLHGGDKNDGDPVSYELEVESR